jgi:2-oxoglutarate ferredoxin oxidoreductase subunit alpha|uniref:2-oxoacid:acceptor oxidoreductase subunit alpha n=1 Tax=candidate division WOR-3 bacterium TaxID=2052148 RepID=A0A7V3VUF0_UNCW3
MKPQKNIKLMTGNEACAEAAIVAGMRFFAGYPITPSSEIAEVLAKRLPEVGGIFIQMEDEIASMGAIIGASLAGLKSMTATSGPGFSLMQENIGYASMAEVPVVVVNVQRGGPSTGLPTLPSQADVMQARWGTHGDHPVIAVAPSTVQDTYEWTIKAFNYSEKYRVPVIILMDEIVGHLNEKIVIPEPGSIEIVNRLITTDPPEKYLPYKMTDDDIPPIAHYGTGYRFNVTGLSHDETGFPTNDPNKIDALYRRINRKIERYKNDIIYYITELLDDAEICLVAYGSSARSAKRAMHLARAENIKVGLFQPYVLWPFPYEVLRELSSRIKRFIVPEMNLGQIAHEVECATRTECIRVNRVDGSPITPQEILRSIKDVSL